MKQFVINIIFYFFLFIMCIIFAQVFESRIHHMKMTDVGYYLTGDYAVIDLKTFDCDFNKKCCVYIK